MYYKVFLNDIELKFKSKYLTKNDRENDSDLCLYVYMYYVCNI